MKEWDNPTLALSRTIEFKLIPQIIITHISFYYNIKKTNLV